MNGFNLPQPQKGMTSLDAAALVLSDGRTTDPEKAEAYATGHTFDMDALEKSALVRWTGFPFSMTVYRNRILFTDDTTNLKTTCLWTEPMDMKTGKRMLRALARLKKLHDDRQ